ncbi:MAG: M20/M25/M40 family metallo-hydrolase [Phycisphaerae bacterium]|nr:M20/M25/M40 family metallo-hydrolase [Phycisphaerae bacterium]
MKTPPAVRERLASIISPRRDEMIADLARFVAIPTGHNHTPGLETFRAILTARLEALGAKAEVIPGDPRPEWLTESTDRDRAKAFEPPPTVVCRRPIKERPRILLAGHLDTVFDPHGPFQSFTLSPDGRTATGPGVVDMKGGILIALVALEALEKMCIPVSWSFLLNSDEETGSYASDRALRAEAARNDLGLALEPALPDGGLVTERKGSGQFLIEAFGTSAHAGRDFEKGVSAVYALAQAITRCERLCDVSRGLTVNIGPLKGGEATNIVPDYAAAWGNVRFPDSTGADELVRGLESIARSFSEAASGMDRAAGSSAPATPSQEASRHPRIRIRHSIARPAKPVTPRTRQLAETIRSVSEALGAPLPFGTSGGVCDGNNLQEAGLPTLDTLGVKGGGLHTQHEWINIESLVERATMLACVLAELSA